MVENAIDFLRQASDEVESRPKYAVLHLATAIEILLKARIVSEHWSIIVKKAPNQKSFLKGDFVSLSLGESIHVLSDVVGTPLKANSERAFLTISNHRNRIVHFFSSDLVSSGQDEFARSVSDIVVSIYYLSEFINQHKDIFDEHAKDLDQAIRAVKQSQKFLETKFLDKRHELDSAEASGRIIRTCRFCNFRSSIATSLSPELTQLYCKVCEQHDGLVTIECPAECGNKLKYFASDGFQIRNCECGERVDQSDLKDMLDIRTNEDYLISGPINCGECIQLNTVVETKSHYLCCECFALAEGVSRCGSCGDLQLGGGDLEYSSQLGCEFCEGRGGWD